MTDGAPIYTLCVGSIRRDEVKHKSLWARIKRWFYMKDQAHTSTKVYNEGKE